MPKSAIATSNPGDPDGCFMLAKSSSSRLHEPTRHISPISRQNANRLAFWQVTSFVPFPRAVLFLSSSLLLCLLFVSPTNLRLFFFSSLPVSSVYHLILSRVYVLRRSSTPTSVGRFPLLYSSRLHCGSALTVYQILTSRLFTIAYKFHPSFSLPLSSPTLSFSFSLSLARE